MNATVSKTKPNLFFINFLGEIMGRFGKNKITITLSDRVMRWVSLVCARTGKSVEEVINDILENIVVKDVGDELIAYLKYKEIRMINMSSCYSFINDLESHNLLHLVQRFLRGEDVTLFPYLNDDAFYMIQFCRDDILKVRTESPTPSGSPKRLEWII